MNFLRTRHAHDKLMHERREKREMSAKAIALSTVMAAAVAGAGTTDWAKKELRISPVADKGAAAGGLLAPVGGPHGACDYQDRKSVV